MACYCNRLRACQDARFARKVCQEKASAATPPLTMHGRHAAPAFRRLCKAIEAVRRGVWAMNAFRVAGVRMSDPPLTPLDVLNRPVDRGLNVAAMFCRPWLPRPLLPPTGEMPGDLIDADLPSPLIEA